MVCTCGNLYIYCLEQVQYLITASIFHLANPSGFKQEVYRYIPTGHPTDEEYQKIVNPRDTSVDDYRY